MDLNGSRHVDDSGSNGWPKSPDDLFPDDPLIAGVIEQVVSRGGNSQKVRVILRVSDKAGIDIGKASVLVSSYCKRHGQVLAQGYMDVTIAVCLGAMPFVGFIWAAIRGNLHLTLVFMTIELLFPLTMSIRNRMLK